MARNEDTLCLKGDMEVDSRSILKVLDRSALILLTVFAVCVCGLGSALIAGEGGRPVRDGTASSGGNVEYGENQGEDKSSDKEGVAGAADDEGVEEGDDDSEEEAEDEKLTIENMTLQQLTRFKSFVYRRGGRDPFNFRIETIEESADANQSTAGNKSGGTGGDSKWSTEKMADYLNLKSSEIFIYMTKQHDYKRAVEIAEQVQTVARDQWGGRPADAALDNIFRQIVTNGRTAKRLYQAELTEKEFYSLPIKLSGVRWSDKASSAIVNDKVCEPGSSVVNLPGDVSVQIESIDENGVVFVYKGQKFRKTVNPEK